MQGLLQQFDLGEFERVWLGNMARLTPDLTIRSWWIDGEPRRLVHVLETDFISSLDDVRSGFEKLLGYAPQLIKVKRPLKDFEDAALHKYAEVFATPENFEQVRLYI